MNQEMLISRRSSHRSCSWVWLALVSLTVIRCTVATTPTSSSSVSNADPPAPQPATPPAFDQLDEPSDASDTHPADPSPATPPSIEHVEHIRHKDTDRASGAAPEALYTGKEYRFKRFVIRPAQLKLEGCLLAALAAYIFLSYRGKRTNEDRVAHWWDAHAELLRNEFSRVGTGSPKGYIADGPALYYGYATGRRGCESLMVRFALRPRQDLPFMLYEEARAAIDFTWTGRSDRLELVWRLAPSQPQCTFESKDSFVWALVEKRVMSVLREDRWDVRKFTEVKESSQLPSHLVLMSESGELSEQILKSKEIGLTQLLKSNPVSLEWFDSLVLSGTPPDEPLLSELPLPPAPVARTLTLRLRLPPPSRIRDPLPLIALCFALIDGLSHSIVLGPLAAAKVTKRRAEVSAALLDETRKESERAREDERRRRLKAAQDDRLAKMSPSEQRKHDERERRKNAAKMAKTIMKRK